MGFLTAVCHVSFCLAFDSSFPDVLSSLNASLSHIASVTQHSGVSVSAHRELFTRSYGIRTEGPRFPNIP